MKHKFCGCLAPDLAENASPINSSTLHDSDCSWPVQRESHELEPHAVGQSEAEEMIKVAGQNERSPLPSGWSIAGVVRRQIDVKGQRESDVNPRNAHAQCSSIHDTCDHSS